VVYDWTRPATALLGVGLMEFGDFAMMRRMLLGIKDRGTDPASQLDLVAPQPAIVGRGRGWSRDFRTGPRAGVGAVASITC
jgi:hypothetical protein